VKNYTYFIIHKISGKRYIGFRSDKHSDKADILTGRYNTSSSDKLFKHEFKHHRNHFLVRVLNQFKSKDEALSHEIELHKRYNVDKNPLYYNKARQTSTRFLKDTSGTVIIRDLDGKTYRVNKEDFDNSDEYTSVAKNKSTFRDKFGIFVHLYMDDPRVLSGECVGVCKDRIMVQDKDGNKFFVYKDNERLASGHLFIKERIKKIKERIPLRLKCKYCSELIYNRHINIHEDTCKANLERIDRIAEIKSCIYCGRECSICAIKQHESLCNKNPNRIEKQIQVHTSVNCEHCGIKVSRTNYGRHLLAKHGIGEERKKIKCEHCSKEYDEFIIKKHTRTCSKNLNKVKEIQVHETVECSNCHKAVRKSNYDKHLPSCIDAPIECSNCHRLIPRRGMTRHIKYCMKKG